MLMPILWICVIAAFTGIAITIVGNTMLASARRTLDVARRYRGNPVDLDALKAKAKRAGRFRAIGVLVSLIALSIGGPLVEYEWWQRGVLTDEGFVLMLLLHALSAAIAIWVLRKRGF